MDYAITYRAGPVWLPWVSCPLHGVCTMGMPDRSYPLGHGGPLSIFTHTQASLVRHDLYGCLMDVLSLH